MTASAGAGNESATTGLRTTVHLIRNAYETGRKLAADCKETMAI